MVGVAEEAAAELAAAETVREALPVGVARKSHLREHEIRLGRVAALETRQRILDKLFKTSQEPFRHCRGGERS